MAVNEVDAMLRRLRTDFEFYASKVLRIKNKAGAIVPFVLNTAQRHAHRLIEEQKQRIGKVRAMVLKARQQGLSTYIQGRFYRATSMWPGNKAFILTHRDDATQNLFDMVDRFYTNDTIVHPRADRSNAKQLRFDRLDGGYAVATAGGDAFGRSFTGKLFHGSEVAFWKNIAEHLAGLGQAIPDAPGTEIIFESTGNGLGNEFHGRWEQAVAGANDYLPIFIPWFWSDEYSLQVPKDWEFSPEEREIQELYKLTPEQLYWRNRKMLNDFHNREDLFQQEYPADANEAFIGKTDTLLSVLSVLRARKTTVTDPFGALVLGVDPARFGDDRTAFAWRKGRKVPKVEAYHGLSTMNVAGMVARIITDTPDLRKVFIDVIGIGAGVFDRLMELGYEDKVVPVGAGERADEPNKFVNRRAEMWFGMKQWFENGPCDIPDNDELQADLLAPGYKYNSSQQLLIESKDDMRKRGVKSPDIGDALAMTFAFPVSAIMDAIEEGGQRAGRGRRSGGGNWRAR